MNAIEKYRRESWDDIPVFLQPWWLDLVAEGRWDVCLLSNPEEVFAVMPLVFADGKKIAMPPLTPFLGPWWKIYSDKYAKRISHEVNYMTELIRQVPAFSRFEQRWHLSKTNWLPFYWQGFEQTTKYHYVIEETGSAEIVWDEFKDKIRKQIRNAEKELTVSEAGNATELFRQWKLTFGKQRLETPVTENILKNVLEETRKRQCGKVFFAADKQGNIHGALFIVWDKHSAYGLLSGADPGFKNSAPALLLWTAIQFSVSKKLPFNFCGSMIKPVENFLRDFGGKQFPYFEITKTTSRWLKLRRAAALAMGAMKNR